MESTCKKKAKMKDPRADRSSSSRSVVDNLPNQIMMEILSRLPIRTLMACRCVSKSWLLLTSDTHFAKLHSTRAPTEILVELPDEHRLSTDLALGDFEERKGSVFKLHFDFVFQLPCFKVGPDNDVNFQKAGPYVPMVKLVNSCHGFLCYSGTFNEFVVIWNPIMGQFITFPGPRKDVNLIECSNYAFGFSPKANKFKLLRTLLLRDRVPGMDSSSRVAEVFTFEEGGFSWRKVDYFPCIYERPVFVAGAVYWAVKDICSVDTGIYCFDFDNEQFGDVPLPPQLNRIDMNKVKIGIFEGYLSLTNFTNTSCIDVWVMKKCGVQDSWTKLFSIEKKSRYSGINYEFELIKYMESGEVLMLRRTGCLVAYDPSRKTIRSIGRVPTRDFKPIYPTCGFKAIVYSPSLFRLEDALMAKHVYGLDVKLRPVLKICRSQFICDRIDPKECWRLNEENSAEHSTVQDRSKALSRNKKKQSSEAIRTVTEALTKHCKDKMRAPATGEDGHERLNSMGLVQSPVSMKHFLMEAHRKELRKETNELKELVERFQQKRSRIERLKEDIKVLEQLK